MLPDSFVCWKWRNPGYRSTFGPETVNTLRRMIARWYRRPHEFICVTDDVRGLDSGIRCIPDRADWRDLPSPYGLRGPSCYRRLRAFHPDAARDFGHRFVSLDLDVVVLRELEPLVDRDEDFVGWQDPHHPKQFCGSIFMLTAGSRPDVWNRFDPKSSPRLAAAAGYRGSDQGWVSYCLAGEAKWGRPAGIASFRRDLRDGALLPHVDDRLVVFHGRHDPWAPHCQSIPWIAENYR